MKFHLENKSVLITGASSGIGEALACECARRGARLALASRRLAGLRRVARRCLELGAPEARVYALDVRRASQARAAARRAAREFGGLDVLVNNAGIHAFAPVASLPESLLRDTLDTNLFGPLRLIQAVLPLMRAQGHGMIVQIGSTLAFRSIPFGAAYSASKAALARLTESLRDETARFGIHVLHAAPGVVTTALRENARHIGAEPPPPASLPFPRAAYVTAREICDAMEKKKREVISAAWPVKLWARWLVAHFPALVDRRMETRQ